MSNRRRSKHGTTPKKQPNEVARRKEGASNAPSRSVQVSYTEESSTAIPPPSMLAAYNDAAPNGGDRILTLAEDQQTHRHHLEEIVIHGDNRRADRGLYIGGAVIITALICGTILVALGKDAQGMFIGVAALTTALGSFFWGWHKRRKQVEEIRSR